MANVKVRDLATTQNITNDNKLMILTDEDSNQVKNITVENFIDNINSSDTDNGITIGIDGKLYVDNTDTGVTAGTYAFPQNLEVDSKGRITGIVNGTPASVPIATSSSVGVVKPDNDTIIIDGNGTIACKQNNGYQMFDIVMKDHVLSYAETLGLAPLGTYVYKEAIAGTRYGYPDFYQKCVDEYNDLNNTVIHENWTQPILTANGTMGGSSFAVSSNVTQLSGNDVFNAFNGVTSGVGYFHSVSGVTTGYIDMYNPKAINVTNIKIYNQDNVANRASSAGNIYGSNNGTDWTLITAYTNLVQTAGGSWDISLSGNTNYYKYYRLESTAGGSESYWVINEIELTATYVLGVQNSNKHRFYDIADKATFDNMYAITGEAWYYGVDTTNERVFLPRSTRFKNGTSSDVGEYNPAGLPNITGSIVTFDEVSGAFETDSIRGVVSGGGNITTYIRNFDSSRSSSIYGASNTVEYSSTKLIPYMVVGNQSTWSGMTDVVNQGMTILSQVNAGLATKVDLDGSNATFPHIIDTYENGTSGYNVYSNGYCEQWGQTGIIADYATVTVTLLKTYKDENYNIAQATYLAGAGDDTDYNDNVALRKLTKTSSSFQLYNRGATDGGRYVDWKTSGYLAQGEY